MENLKKIAVLIDADNTQLSKLVVMLREISTYGRIVVKRAYGNWKKDSLKNWENELKRLAIKAEQKFDYVTGKNATDIALVIDAVDLLHNGIYDTFAIIASDSDYTPIAIKLRESAVNVIGVGVKHTPESFKNACDEFIYLENLSVDSESENSVNAENTENTKSKLTTKMTAAANDTNSTIKKCAAKKSDTKPEIKGIKKVHELLKMAFGKYQNDDGYANIGAAGEFIKRTKPDFDSRTFGFPKLTDLVMAYPEKYETKTSHKGGKATKYKCK